MYKEIYLPGICTGHQWFMVRDIRKQHTCKYCEEGDKEHLFQITREHERMIHGGEPGVLVQCANCEETKELWGENEKGETK